MQIPIGWLFDRLMKFDAYIGTSIKKGNIALNGFGIGFSSFKKIIFHVLFSQL